MTARVKLIRNPDTKRLVKSTSKLGKQLIEKQKQIGGKPEPTTEPEIPKFINSALPIHDLNNYIKENYIEKTLTAIHASGIYHIPKSLKIYENKDENKDDVILVFNSNPDQFYSIQTGGDSSSKVSYSIQKGGAQCMYCLKNNFGMSLFMSDHLEQCPAHSAQAHFWTKMSYNNNKVSEHFQNEDAYKCNKCDYYHGKFKNNNLTVYKTETLKRLKQHGEHCTGNPVSPINSPPHINSPPPINLDELNHENAVSIPELQNYSIFFTYTKRQGKLAYTYLTMHVLKVNTNEYLENELKSSEINYLQNKFRNVVTALSNVFIISKLESHNQYRCIFYPVRLDVILNDSDSFNRNKIITDLSLNLYNDYTETDVVINVLTHNTEGDSSKCPLLLMTPENIIPESDFYLPKDVELYKDTAGTLLKFENYNYDDKYQNRKIQNSFLHPSKNSYETHELKYTHFELHTAIEPETHSDSGNESAPDSGNESDPDSGNESDPDSGNESAPTPPVINYYYRDTLPSADINYAQVSLRTDISSMSNIYIIQAKADTKGIYECVFYPVMLHYLLDDADLSALKTKCDGISELSHTFLSYYLTAEEICDYTVD
jgi:hypothetical protein